MLALTFWFIHVPFLVFLYSKGSKFTFLHVDIKFFQPRVQKGQSSPQRAALVCLRKTNGPRVQFSGFSRVSETDHQHHTILVPSHCTFMVSSEIRKQNLTKFSFFNILLAIWSPFVCP